MGGAWIAVIGTLCGVGLTAVSGLISSVLVARRARSDAEWQAAEAIKDKRRLEVREAFVDFLTCYTALRDRILVFNERHVPQSPGDTRFVIESVAPDESTAFKRSADMLLITAAAETSETATRASLGLWALAAAAERRDAVQFIRELEAGTAVIRELYSSMRSELGIGSILTLPPEDWRSYFEADHAQPIRPTTTAEGASSGDDQA